jgi:nitrite reductase/ring-hydroxylating ferredoxin subunit
MAQEYKIKDLQSLDLKPGEKKEIELEGLDSKVLLLNAGGKIQAIGPRCTHYGAPLVKGVLSTKGRLTCPWHGGESFRSRGLISATYFKYRHHPSGYKTPKLT